ncbi:hypothetical protein BFS30_20630 [Pedobacter steynii]|uniref:Uncharacterized protein n=1 Tax=Pedobacter steynii TaxID=430522 RepID=A0A1D7QL10_9SPHI|nr:hypothetical protein BFS30_20630 [Pedobacter steynii]
MIKNAVEVGFQHIGVPAILEFGQVIPFDQVIQSLFRTVESILCLRHSITISWMGVLFRLFSYRGFKFGLFKYFADFYSFNDDFSSTEPNGFNFTTLENVMYGFGAEP